MPDGAALPRFAFPPAAMDAETAGYYVGQGKDGFLAQVAAGKAPQPLQPSPRRKIWLREDLDLYLAVLAGTHPTVDWLDPRAAWRHAGGAQASGW